MMLPKGWESLFLGDVFSFKNGLNGEKSLYGAGAKFVNVMDVFRGPRLRHSEIVGEMAVSPRQLTEFAVRQGDVLFNRTSETYDEIALSTVYLDTAPAVFGGFVIRARPSGKALDQEFCVYSFQAASIRREMIRRGQGAIRSNIGQADLATVPMLLPPLPEQKRIAEILSTWDRAIETVEALIANARAQKKALMQSLLTGKHRLTGFSGDWVSVPFDNVFKVVNNKKTQVQKALYQEQGQTPIVDQGQNFIAGFTDHPSIYEAVPAIVFGDHTRILKWVDFPFCPGADGTQVLKTSDSVDLCFGYHLLSNCDIPNLGYSRHMRALKEISFEVPADRMEQEEVATILTASDVQIRTLEAQSQTFRQEKSALMQQLLTGKRRVKVSEKEAAHA